MKFSRSATVVAGTVLALVGTVGLTSPASAAYANDPVSRVWRADGPVHSSLGTSTRLFVGGKFFGGGGVAALNPSNGALIWSVTADGDVRGMALSSDGSTLFVGGGFTHVNGAVHRHLAAINVATGAVVATWRGSTSGLVRDLVVNGNTLYVGGVFTSIGGTVQKGLGALNASTGKRIPDFTGSVDKKVMGLAKTSTSLIVTGTFTAVNGQPRASIASFNLSTYKLTSWAPFRLCSDCNTYWDVVVDSTNAYVATSGPGGNLGAFNLVTGANPWHYVHADGDVQSVGMPGDGLLYIGGHFGQFVGSRTNPRTVMAAVNPATGQVNTGFHPTFYKTYPGMWTISSTPGMLYGGGDFTGVGTGPSATNNHVPFLAAFKAL